MRITENALRRIIRQAMRESDMSTASGKTVVSSPHAVATPFHIYMSITGEIERGRLKASGEVTELVERMGAEMRRSPYASLPLVRYSDGSGSIAGFEVSKSTIDLLDKLGIHISDAQGAYVIQSM